MATSPTEEVQARRAAARRTALALALVALGVYLAFLLRGLIAGGTP